MSNVFLTSNCYSVLPKIVSQLEKKPAEYKLLFILTASEVEDGDLWWLNQDRKALTDAGFKVEDFTFTNKSQSQVQNAFSNTDGVFLSGGNTFFLLEQIQKSKSAALMQEFVSEGKLYIGSSAGSVVAGKDIDFAKKADDPTLAPNLTSTQGLGFVDLLILPHWGNAKFEGPWKKTIEELYTVNEKILLLRDNQYLRVLKEEYVIETI